MKKMITMVGVMLIAVAVGFAGSDWTGTRIGNASIDDDVAGGIAIGDGTTNGRAHVTASGAGQIGIGSNGVANTLKFRDQYVMLSITNGGVAAISAAQLSATAIDGAAITNITAANIISGGTLPEITVGGTLGVSGNVTLSGTTATVTNNLVVNKNTTLTGTTLHTGIASFTAVPSFNASLVAAGTNVLLTSTGPSTYQAAPKWFQFSHNGTNYVIPAYAP
jgi:hypothetical protein